MSDSLRSHGLSIGFSRPDYWSGQPFPSPGDLPNPGIEPRSPALQADSLPAEPPGKPYVFIQPLFFGFPSHVGPHRTLSRVPLAIQQALISYLFYTHINTVYVHPNLPVHPTSLFPPWYPYICSLHLCFYFAL